LIADMHAPLGMRGRAFYCGRAATCPDAALRKRPPAEVVQIVMQLVGGAGFEPATLAVCAGMKWPRFRQALLDYY